MDKEGKPQLKIEVHESAEPGFYSNTAIISHSRTEFVVDFASMLPGMQALRVRSRIIMAPEHAKRLLMSLQDNISRYEAANGKIVLPDSAVPGFGGMGQA